MDRASEMDDWDHFEVTHDDDPGGDRETSDSEEEDSEE